MTAQQPSAGGPQIDLLVAAAERALAIVPPEGHHFGRVRVAVEGLRLELDVSAPAAAGTAETPPIHPAGVAGSVTSGVPPTPEVAGLAPEPGPEPPADEHRLRASAVGTFYRRPGPGEAEFVQPGDRVTFGDHVAIVEAMKLMIPVEADIDGTVVEILVGDGEPVEYGQELMTFTKEPS